jgi:hypothetical protein
MWITWIENQNDVPSCKKNKQTIITFYFICIKRVMFGHGYIQTLKAILAMSMNFDDSDFSSCSIVPGHWVGPYGVYVPNHIEWVPAEDGVNRHTKTGNITERHVAHPLTKEQYIAKYCWVDTNGMVYYNVSNNNQ